MFKSMLSSTASFSGSNIASSITQNLSPRKASIQDGTLIEEHSDEIDNEAVEAALLEAAYEDDRNEIEAVDKKLKASSLVDKCQSST